ncbi:peptidase family M1-domain-containing protein [Chytriomyces sp. MP71]|nr:peptidase family M1-domain-containing protein [Chytriomyces sp. MP71]
MVLIHASPEHVWLVNERISLSTTLSDNNRSFHVLPDVVSCDADNEYCILSFKRALIHGIWKAHIPFNSTLNANASTGFYLSETIETNQTSLHPAVLASTHFFPTSARTAFPCLDEPNLKSPFQLNIDLSNVLIDAGYSCASNAPLASLTRMPVESGPDLTRFIFQQTPRMSTYLLAYIISPFVQMQGQTRTGVTVSVLAPKSRASSGTIALSYGITHLDFYQETYGIAYPLSKLDLVAVPKISVGAMENWGCIFFQESTLLSDRHEDRSDAETAQAIASITAHELAHQWFGDLVTMRWWSDVWLNEGFATFMTYKAVDKAERTWKYSELFVSDTLERALELDGLERTHPVAATVNKSSEINSVFDALAYDKGASVIRMLEGWLDDVVSKAYFMNQIAAYLNTNAYSNADTLDLWAAFDRPSLNVSSVMDDWIRQPGFPVIVVKADEFGVGGFHVTQRRYGGTGNETWTVPLRMHLYGRSGVRVGGAWSRILGKNDLLELEDDTHIFLLNAGRTGFYRVLYPDWVWNLFADWASQGVFSDVDFAGLLSDSFALSFFGYLNQGQIPLLFVKALVHSQSPVVWKVALKKLNQLSRIVILDSSFGLLETFQRNVLDGFVADLSWTEQSQDKSLHHIRATLRASILRQALVVNHAPTVNQALDYFQTLKASWRETYLNQSARIACPKHLEGLVWDAGVMHGTDADFDFVLQTFTETLGNTTTTKLNRLLLRSLGMTHRGNQAARLLAHSLEAGWSRGDVASLLKQLAAGSGGYISVWKFIKAHWKDLIALWRNVDGDRENWISLNVALKEVVAAFVDFESVTDAETLFLGGSESGWFVPPGADAAVKEGLEVARKNIQWLRLNSGVIREWLWNET